MAIDLYIGATTGDEPKYAYVRWLNGKSTYDKLYAPIGQTTDVNTIELDLQLTKALNRYKEFIYDIDGNVTTINIWADSTKVVKYYSITYLYDLGNLIKKSITRVSDSFLYSNNFSYDGNGNLTSINISTP